MQSAKLCVGNAIMFNGDRTARPYKWAQHLAGIDFLPEVAPLLLASRETSDSGEARDLCHLGINRLRCHSQNHY